MVFRVLTRTAIAGWLLISHSQAQSGEWTVLSNPATGDIPGVTNLLAREECSFTQAGGKFYLMGGRRPDPVQEYDPQTGKWRNLKATKDTLNHFQAVSSAGLIYVICAFAESQGRGYPKEPPAAQVSIYDPLSDTWVKGMTIPEARRRGSAGVVEYNGKFYVVLGNTVGHTGPGAPWLDEFDPSTNTWTPLPDAPRFRDHFQAAVANGKLYAMGGRQSINANPIFTNLEKVDVYDFAKGSWSTLPGPESDLKTKRSGAIVATLGDEILFAGGSNPPVYTKGAYDSVHAFNTLTNTWRPLANLHFGRQVTGGFINNSGFYVASGSGGTGGSPTLTSLEVFFLNGRQPATGDPLVPGKLAPAESSFNMGIVANGQSLSKSFDIRHISGNQGVIIASLAISGDPAFKLKTQVTAPFLLRPGKSTPVEISFSSTGAVPQASTLDITCAVPPGLTLKVPLDANRTAAAIAPPRKAASDHKRPISRSVTPVFQKTPGPGLWNSLGKKTGYPRERK